MDQELQRVRLPDGFLPDGPPAEMVATRDAATVVLLRESGSGPQVFLQRRVTQMPFAGGMTVFPGGGVDTRDTETAISWAGEPREWWAERFGCAPELAGALVCAAVRETFEESGVLLAGESADTVVADPGRFAEARAALVRRELSFAGFLAERQLVLRADLLRPWAHWITPEGEPRRYDTRFFVAALPEGQRADGDTSEADHAEWRAPQEALADQERGYSLLLPPTWVTLSELAEYSSVPEILAAERQIEPITPRLIKDHDEASVELPDSVWRILRGGEQT